MFPSDGCDIVQLHGTGLLRQLKTAAPGLRLSPRPTRSSLDLVLRRFSSIHPLAIGLGVRFALVAVAAPDMDTFASDCFDRLIEVSQLQYLVCAHAFLSTRARVPSAYSSTSASVAKKKPCLRSNLVQRTAASKAYYVFMLMPCSQCHIAIDCPRCAGAAGAWRRHRLQSRRTRIGVQAP